MVAMIDRFGKYELLRKIASGGMAEVYLAREPSASRAVALKRIRPRFSGDAEFIAMLREEARISMGLRHPNIARTLEFGKVGSQYYLAMEYVEGIDLYQLLLRLDEIGIGMPHSISAWIGAQVCAGLDHAHQSRDANGAHLHIVHRDVSPMNILLSRNGEVKVCDFGIAKASTRAGMTKSGVIKGKFHYLSPEYAQGLPIDHRSDIFSTGICLWEMICGRMLYLEDDDHSLLELVRAAQITPPRSLRPDLPEELERIVLRALSPEREQRYPGAWELGAELSDFLQRWEPNFARDQVGQFLHNALGKRGQPRPLQVASTTEHQDAGGLEQSIETGHRKPDQETARIDLRDGETQGSNRTRGPGQWRGEHHG